MFIINLKMSLLVITVQMVSTTPSVERLTTMAKMEYTIHDFLDDHSHNLEGRISLVQEYLKDFDESSGHVMKEFGQEVGALKITDSPILSYRMIRRYAIYIRPFYKEMTPDSKQALLKICGSGKPEVEMLSQWPSDLDLEHSMEALLRIHHVYNMDLEQFTAGNLMETHTRYELTTTQCQEIGEYAIQLKQFTSGIIWLEVALKKSKETGVVADISKLLQMAIVAHDMAWDKKGSEDYFFFLHKLNETVEGKRIGIRDVEIKKGNLQLKFWGLCAGKNYQTNGEIAQLFCWYERKRNAAWTLNPLKIEELSSSPYLVQIHDVLRNQDIEAVKNYVAPGLKRSSRTSEARRESYRSYLTPNDSLSLSRRVELITGLFVTPPDASAPFLVQAYATGGHYECHVDYEEEKDKDNNLIATLLFYLDDVDIGGYTAFPTIGVAVKPIKGSAVFWFNMLRNGKGDIRTKHGGCPVVHGQKWIMTKFVLFNAQMRVRPCGLSSDE